MEEREKDEAKKAGYCYLLYSICVYSRKTPYNFDITLREVEMNTKMNFYEENLDLFILKDLKGNQHDTLGYLFFKDELTFPIMS